MSFLELILLGEAFGDAADLEEALAAFREARPEGSSWSELCADPDAAPTIHRYRSFEAFLDNEDAIETLHPTAAMLEPAHPEEAPPGDPDPGDPPPAAGG